MTQAPKTVARVMGEAYSHYILTPSVRWQEDDGKPIVFRNMIPRKIEPLFLISGTVASGYVGVQIKVNLPTMRPLRWRSDYD